MVSPVFEKLASNPELANITFAKVNTDEQEDITSEAGIRGMPTFTAFQSGNKLDEVVGADPHRLEQLVRSAL